MSHWHTLSSEDTIHQLGADTGKGLSSQEAARRLAQSGENVLDAGERASALAILAGQFKSFLVLLLLAAAAVSGPVLGEWLDAGVILGIVLLNGLLGFRQEYQAERALEALRALARPRVRVRRDGRVQEVDAAALVPGDVILLEAGNLVPADARILEAANLAVQEAALTGESVPVEKSPEALDDPDLPLGDRRNMLFMGTVVTRGRAVAAVVATGMDTQLGRIAHSLQAIEEEPSPLQEQLARLGRILVGGALGLIGLLTAVGLAQGQAPKTVFLTAVSMAVAAVPEGLPAVVTIALALGAKRMLARRALIRRLSAVETLGSVTVICSDKTGTLTQNRMTVDRTVTPEGEQALEGDGFRPSELQRSLLAAAGLCTDAVVRRAAPDEEADPDGLVRIGDPTETALVAAALRLGMPKEDLEAGLPRVAELPFDSVRKRMSTVHELRRAGPEIPALLADLAAGGLLVCCKGACDELLERCSQEQTSRGVRFLTEERRRELSEENEALAASGVRVLGVAVRHLESLPERPEAEEIERDLTFLGMVGMQDPVRPEAVEAVATCRRAGIRPVMITGDHPNMARAVGERLGLVAGRGEEVLTGRTLERLSDEELRARVQEISLYARVSPEHKLRIVDALKHRGEIVAMTGDGVNDAPSLKTADIGVAMGVTGTDVAKEASDMVLLDDNFATIVAAVEEGRTIFGNIKRFVRYLLACNTGELGVFLLAPLFGLPLPLLPVQILWMNLVTDGFPALGLGVEPSDPDAMNRPPGRPGSPILGLGDWLHVLGMGALLALGASLVGWKLASDAAPAALWRTGLFNTLVFGQLFAALAERSETRTLWELGLRSNPHMVWAVAGTALLQLGVVYIPWAQPIFRTTALPPGPLALSIAGGLAMALAVEAEKLLRRCRRRNR